MNLESASPPSVWSWRRLRPAGWGTWWAYASLGVMPMVLLLCAGLVGLRVEHILFTLVYLALAWAGPGGRRFSAVSAPFVATGLAYDFLRLAVSWRSSNIHTGDLLELDRSLFPGVLGASSFTELIAGLRSPILDTLTGLGYILYLPEVFLVAAYLYWKGDVRRAQLLGLVFAVTSAIGWIVWLAIPAAPPWYIEIYGSGPAVLSAAPSPAGGARFDSLVHVPVFAHFYSRSWNIFGAMPSLHTSYAVLTAVVCWSRKRGLRLFTLLFAADIGFAAVYLHHHYLLDVVAGAMLAVLVSLCLERLLRLPSPNLRGHSR